MRLPRFRGQMTSYPDVLCCGDLVLPSRDSIPPASFEIPDMMPTVIQEVT